MNEAIGGAVVTLADNTQSHYSNVVSCGVRRSRGSVAVVLRLADGTERIIDGATEVKAVDSHYLERYITTRLFGEPGHF